MNKRTATFLTRREEPVAHGDMYASSGALDSLLKLDATSIADDQQEIPMPFLHATVLSPDADEAVVERLRNGLVKLATTVLAKASDVTSVLIEPVQQGAWFVGGARATAAAHVVITVTAGTNTPEQKAAFVEQTFALLRNLLGSALPEATYVVVNEADPESWGFAGKTVSTRRRA